MEPEDTGNIDDLDALVEEELSRNHSEKSDSEYDSNISTNS